MLARWHHEVCSRPCQFKLFSFQRPSLHRSVFKVRRDNHPNGSWEMFANMSKSEFVHSRKTNLHFMKDGWPFWEKLMLCDGRWWMSLGWFRESVMYVKAFCTNQACKFVCLWRLLSVCFRSRERRATVCYRPADWMMCPWNLMMGFHWDLQNGDRWE
jgi:hypothetical protein